MDTLIEDVAAFKAIARTAGDDPWARARRPAASPEPNYDHGAVAAHADEHTGETLRGSPAGTDRQWPLKMVGLLGEINFKDPHLFDDKVMLAPEYQWNGIKGGAAWKIRVERYFIMKAPVLWVC